VKLPPLAFSTHLSSILAIRLDPNRKQGDDQKKLKEVVGSLITVVGRAEAL
jgi:hypothetical protein